MLNDLISACACIALLAFALTFVLRMPFNSGVRLACSSVGAFVLIFSVAFFLASVF